MEQANKNNCSLCKGTGIAYYIDLTDNIPDGVITKEYYKKAPCPDCMEQENKEPKEEQVSNLKPGKHEEMYSKFKNEIWELRAAAFVWLKEEITDARFREIIGQYLLKIDKDWHSRYTKLEEENKELRSEIDKHTNQVLKLDKENERLKGKVKELEDLNNTLSLRAQF